MQPLFGEMETAEITCIVLRHFILAAKQEFVK